MSRLIKVFVKPTLFTCRADPGPNVIPLLNNYSNDSKTIEYIPEGGAYCQFITTTEHIGKTWIKVLFKEAIGWITLEDIKRIYEIDSDENGNMVETLAYPYPPDD
jgi:hypothetical protein